MVDNVFLFISYSDIGKDKRSTPSVKPLLKLIPVRGFGNWVPGLGLSLQVLPVDLREKLLQHPRRSELLEVVLDLGRRPEARFLGDGGGEYLRDEEVTREDLEAADKAVGQFGGDNRAGVEGTLHRISAIRNRRGSIVGLTCRVGRAVTGHIDMIRDILSANQSILFLGRPGVGKTTVIREMARVLADELKKRVVIVDTSNEIGGDGDVPHPAIGGARRMQVPDPSMQHKVMVEAVENHMPEVVIVDEIGTEAEALACRTIAERGVMLVGTAHGQMLENLIKNPTLSDLVGGVQSVTLGDDEARVRGTQKSVLERKAPPTFPLVLEMRERHFWVGHQTDRSVDALLHGRRPTVEVRTRDDKFNVMVERRLYDSHGNGRNDGDFDFGLGNGGLTSPSAVNSSGRQKQASVESTYFWAAKLGHVPDKDAMAERHALTAPSFVTKGGGRGGEWEEEFVEEYGGGFVSAWPGKRGTKRGPRGVRPR
eukprot:TRINITY_DN5707_c0_g2_i2.p1 TRINITY_DN5707_c0_g2~~TRINITY_DN5707_c0_g2_i2.p1  ORF type:complete len:482 (+),score=112.76 TRINITY_DN5707_c0_g2_i2:216-1661(+)